MLDSMCILPISSVFFIISNCCPKQKIQTIQDTFYAACSWMTSLSLYHHWFNIFSAGHEHYFYIPIPHKVYGDRTARINRFRRVIVASNKQNPGTYKKYCFSLRLNFREEEGWGSHRSRGANPGGGGGGEARAQEVVFAGDDDDSSSHLNDCHK